MPEKLNTFPNERVDRNDFNHLTNYATELSQQINKAKNGTNLNLLGASYCYYGLRVFHNPAISTTSITVHSGLGADSIGRFINDETGTDSQTIHFRTFDAVYFLEVEIRFVEDGSDSRAFWDQTVSGSGGINGSEVAVSDTKTRLTPVWRIKQPIREGITNNFSPILETPPSGDPTGIIVLPLAVIKVDAGGNIVNATVDADNFLVERITSGVAFPASTGTTDRRSLLYQGRDFPWLYINQTNRSDFSIQSDKDAFDAVTTILQEIKYGSAKTYVSGTIVNEIIDPIAAARAYNKLRLSTDPGTEDAYVNRTLVITSGRAKGWCARILYCSNLNIAGGFEYVFDRPLPKDVASANGLLRFPEIPPVGDTVAIIENRTKPWFSLNDTDSNRGLDAIDDEIVDARIDYFFYGATPPSINHTTLQESVSASKAEILTVGDGVISNGDYVGCFVLGDPGYVQNGLRALIAALGVAGVGGHIKIKEGTYDFTGGIAGTLCMSLAGLSNLVIEGCGDETVLEFDTAAGQMFYLANCSNIVIKNLKISSSSATFASGISLGSNCHNIIIDNVTFSDNNDVQSIGVVPGGVACSNIKIRNCRTDNQKFVAVDGNLAALTSISIRECYQNTGAKALTYGVYLRGDVSDLLVDKNSFVGTDGTCFDVRGMISLENALSNRITNNFIYNALYGITFTSSTYGCILQGNSFLRSSVGGNGITVSTGNCRSISVVNNTFYQFTNGVVSSVVLEDVSFVNNKISDGDYAWTHTTSALYNIYWNGNRLYSLVEGAFLVNNAATEIHNLHITNNKFYDIGNVGYTYTATQSSMIFIAGYLFDSDISNNQARQIGYGAVGANYFDGILIKDYMLGCKINNNEFMNENIAVANTGVSNWLFVGNGTAVTFNSSGNNISNNTFVGGRACVLWHYEDAKDNPLVLMKDNIFCGNYFSTKEDLCFFIDQISGAPAAPPSILWDIKSNTFEETGMVTHGDDPLVKIEVFRGLIANNKFLAPTKAVGPDMVTVTDGYAGVYNYRVVGNIADRAGVDPTMAITFTNAHAPSTAYCEYPT